MASPSPARCSQRSDRRILSSTGGAGFSSGKKSAAARISAAATPRGLFEDDDTDSGRVRVSVRVRPKNDEDIYYDSEFIDCLELQPELKRLKLRKNNWSSESYIFDDVFTGSASQKRVYEAVAKPVVESVLSGYNGTVMAYGQTGTGKTYTIGSLGNDNSAERGMMARAMEDVLAEISLGLDTLSVSYLQAMKVVNVVKLKEEYDSESKYRKLECQIDNLTAEIERHHKDKLQLEKRLFEREMTLAEAENKLAEAESKLVESEKMLAEAEEELAATSEGQVEDSTAYQMSLSFNEMKVIDLKRKLQEERSRHANIEEQLIEILLYGTRQFAGATSKINLMIELENHQANVTSPRTRAMVIWFALLLITLFTLYFLW